MQPSPGSLLGNVGGDADVDVTSWETQEHISPNTIDGDKAMCQVRVTD